MNTELLQSRNQATVDTPYIQRLDAPLSAESVGGKAANLAEMIGLGIPVPGGFVITNTAFQRFLDDNELREPIEDQLLMLKPDQPLEISLAAERIRELVLAAQIPAEILAAIRETVVEVFRHETLVVRSSAVGEDSREAAFAGQLDSFLGIQSDQQLVDAVLACWASYWSPRALFYQLSKEIQLQGMGVVVQQLATSQMSGVLFTQNPDLAADERDAIVIEYCLGYGDELVSGKLNPGRMVVNRNDFSWHLHATPDQDNVCRRPGGDPPVLEANAVRQLVETALRLESHFACPQDIEWTIDEDGQVFLVQTRPITVDLSVPHPLHDAPSSDRTTTSPRVLWSNANVNENFPEPISPLLYSIASAGYYHYFRNLAVALGFSTRRVALMEYPLRNVIGVHGGRMYYNLTNIHSLLRMAPCGGLLARWFDDFVGVSKAACEEDSTLLQTVRPGLVARAFELCSTAVKTTLQFSTLTRRVARFERTVDDFAQRTETDKLAEKSLQELLQDLRAFLDIRCHRWTNASLADTAAMVTYGALKQLLQHELPDQDQAGLHNTLLKGLQDVVSGQPIVELWKLSRMIRDSPELTSLIQSGSDDLILREIREHVQFADFNAALDEFLRDWGFRCSGELMLTVPSFQERPELLLEILRAYASVDENSPLEQLERQAKARKVATAEVKTALRKQKFFWWLPWPNKANALSRLLKGCHKSIALRERARLKQALLYRRCRAIALAIGDRLVEKGMLLNRDDIFFFTYQEIDELLAGGAMFPYDTKELVSLRQTSHHRFREMKPADSLVLPHGEYVNREEACQHEVETVDSEAELKGIGACGGQVTANATILTEVSECGLLSKGDVLVTKQTDPGWGPVFFLISGLVMERGGMLSHGAILAREYGIPTVVGVGKATRRIASGQTVNVNGDRGVVQILD